MPVSGNGGVPPTGVSAVALNVTAVEPTGWGFFTVWPCGSPMPPDASHVNFISAGAVEPNSVLVPVDSTGDVCIWTYEASHVLVDVNGWFEPGSFEGRAPDRIVDTREGQGAPLGRLGAGQTLRVPVSGVGDVPASGVTAVALNVTAVETDGLGVLHGVAVRFADAAGCVERELHQGRRGGAELGAGAGRLDG